MAEGDGPETSRGGSRRGWAVSAETGVFTISWRESGGPAVLPPEHKGLGTLIITRLLERTFEGKVTLHFAPEGLEWSLTAPAAAVLDVRGTEAG